jgi:hypothetical protein
VLRAYLTNLGTDSCTANEVNLLDYLVRNDGFSHFRSIFTFGLNGVDYAFWNACFFKATD